MKKILIIGIFLMSAISFDVLAQRGNPERRHCDRDQRGYGRGQRHDCIHKDRLNNSEQINIDSAKLEFGDFEKWDNNQNDQPESKPDSSKTLLNNIDNSFGEFQVFEESNVVGITDSESSGYNSKIYWIAAALLLTLIAGFLVKYPVTRKIRYVLLISSLIFFGFYLGGCPCPISSMQHVVLAGLGEEVSWQGMIWFLGLIPITYLFGRIWCGWICHLGALQELIYRKRDKKIWHSERAQKILKWVRIALFAGLIIQLVITKTNLYREIDPFKGIFNLYPTNVVTWVLIGLLILTSIFIYRPFCRAVCPVGLVLGWISKIPGASVFKRTEHCTACASCFRSCEIHAITRDQYSKLNNEECIRCGKCLDACRKKGLVFSKMKNKKDTVFNMKRVA